MLDVIDQRSTQTFDCPAPPADPPSLFDVMAELTARVAPDWEVAQEIDPAGEISIVVMPACDGPRTPSFLLYDRNGRTQVATIRNDNWESERAYASRAEAVGAIIAAAAASR